MGYCKIEARIMGRPMTFDSIEELEDYLKIPRLSTEGIIQIYESAGLGERAAKLALSEGNTWRAIHA